MRHHRPNSVVVMYMVERERLPRGKELKQVFVESKWICAEIFNRRVRARKSNAMHDYIPDSLHLWKRGIETERHHVEFYFRTISAVRYFFDGELGAAHILRIVREREDKNLFHALPTIPFTYSPRSCFGLHPSSFDFVLLTPELVDRLPVRSGSIVIL